MMEILHNKDNSHSLTTSTGLSSEETGSESAQSCLSDRLLNRSWEVRASAFGELVSPENRSVLFDMVECKPQIFFKETTARGQEASLGCLRTWAQGTVALGSSDSSIVHSLIVNYGSVCQERLRNEVVGIIETLAGRFGASKLAPIFSRILSECSGDSRAPSLREAGSKPVPKGLLSKQATGCMQVLTAVLDKLGESMGVRSLIPLVVKLIAVSVGDRGVREECYNFLVAVLKSCVGITIDSLKLPEPQAKELRTRIDPIEVMHESVSTNASVRPIENQDKSLLTKAEKSHKWKDRETAWHQIRISVSEIDEELFQALLRALKQELNVPITVEVCGIVEQITASSLKSEGQRKQLLSALTLRIKDKSAPVKRAVSSALSGFVKNNQSIIDNRWIESDLAAVAKIARLETIQLLDDLLVHLPGFEVCILNNLVMPALAGSAETSVRDSSVLLAKKIIAQAAIISGVDDCVRAIQMGLKMLSKPKQELLGRLLGIPLLTSGNSNAKHVKPETKGVSPRIIEHPKRNPVVQRESRSSLSSVQRKPEVIIFKSTAKELKEKRESAEISEKWFPYISLNDRLADKLSLQFRTVFESGSSSDRIRAMMTGSQSEILEAIKVLHACVGTNSEGWKESWDLLFKWISLTVTIHRDCSQIWKPMTAFITLALSALGRDLTDRESSLLIPFLADKLGNVLLRPRLVQILESVKPMSRTYSELLKQFIAKCHNAKTVIACRKLATETVRNDPTVDRLRAAVLENNAEKIAEICREISDILDKNKRGSISADSLVHALAETLKSMDSSVRESVFPLINKIARLPNAWTKVQLETLKKFVLELLTIVNSREYRESEPEVWANINLSLVHVLANCHRTNAYSVLLSLGSSTHMQPLVIRCIEKVNRSLSQYLQQDIQRRLPSLLRVLQTHVHEALKKDANETAILEDECLMASLKGVCDIAGLVEVGEFVGLHVPSPQERLLWKKILKTYSATQKRRISTME